MVQNNTIGIKVKTNPLSPGFVNKNTRKRKNNDVINNMRFLVKLALNITDIIVREKDPL